MFVVFYSNQQKVTAENQKKVRTEGGKDSVMKALNAHCSSSVVCNVGCAVLGNVIDKCKVANSIMGLLMCLFVCVIVVASSKDINLAEVILRAINTHIYNNEVYKNGCSALARMVDSECNSCSHMTLNNK